jgi:hypothetical protein
MKAGRMFVRATAAASAILFLASGFAPRAMAQTGGASVVFLMIEPDSRAAGMGNSGVAIADNAYAVFWNPAGLAFQEGAEASLTHSTWLPEFDAGLYYENLVGKYEIPGAGTIAGQITFLNLGENEYRDAIGTELGTFRSYDLATGLSYGFNVTKNFALGVGGRVIYSNLAPSTEGAEIETKAGVSAGVDLAGLYRSSSFSLGGVQTTASAGFNLANMGPKIDYTQADSDSLGNGDPIPTNLRFGYALTFDFDQYNSLTLSNDFTKMLTRAEVVGEGESRRVEIDPFYKAIFSAWAPIEVNAGSSSNPDVRNISALNQLMIGLGAEYWYDRLFAARAGYFYESPYNGNRQFLTFGAGVRYSLVGVDFSYIYALEENHPLANTMRFSLLLNFNK